VSLLAEKLAVVENDYSRRKIALQGLLHDASEAYLGDITKWLKQTWPIYNTAEQCLLGQILIKYKADTDVRPYQLHRYVEMADRFMVIYEGMEGEVPFWENTGPEYMQLDDIHWGIIHDLGWFFIDDFRDARSAFLDRFRALSLG
jgi:hypothetical protein